MSPRIGSRIDAVVVSSAVIVPIEFKVGERAFLRDHIEQVWDYALDLKNFHLESHRPPIVPILVATEASRQRTTIEPPSTDGVYRPITVGAAGLRDALTQSLGVPSDVTLEAQVWANGRYRPTPSIVEAARVI